MILAGGGFLGVLIAFAIVGIIVFVAKAGLSMIFSIIGKGLNNTDSLDRITDLAKLKSLLNYWSGEGISDSLKVEEICNRILFLYPDDLEAKMFKVVFCIFNREYNKNDKLIFESLYRLFKEGVAPKYKDDILLSIYLYAYYCSKNDLTDLSKELIHELELKMPDYRIKLDAYIQAYPII